jgi:GNAT superfamily N-acetyltransferase
LGITRAEVEHGFRHSALVAGAYRGDEQVGCLRVASDRTRFAYLMDVFVEPGSRSQGLGKALVRFALDHPDLALVYKWLLGTADAHEVYRRLGFGDLAHPERWMSLLRQRPWLGEGDLKP